MFSILDIKYALRVLLASPKFSAITLFVLVGGLGLSLFTFSFLYSMIYKPLPMPKGELIYRVFVDRDGQGFQAPAREIRQIRDQLDTISHIGTYQSVRARYSAKDAGMDISTSYVEPGFMAFTRVKPVLGRGFIEEDFRPESEPVVLISHYIWQHTLNGDPDAVGRQIRLNETLTRVIGVMPEGFHFPVSARLWLPMPEHLLEPEADEDLRLNAYIKLNPGADEDMARQELGERLNALYQQNVHQLGKPPGQLNTRFFTFPMAQAGGAEGVIVFTFFNLIALAILLLACINVGNLILARAVEKSKETAIRSALGAPQSRLIMQLMWEGVILTLVGTLLALLLVAGMLDYTDFFLRSYFGEGLAFWWLWQLDIETCVMALVYCVASLFFTCFLPAYRSCKLDINETLRDGTRGAQGKKAGRASRLLVVAQIFLISFLLMIGALSTYLAQSYLNLDTGEELDRVLVSRDDPSLALYEDDEKRAEYYVQLLQELSRSPEYAGAMARASLGGSRLSLPHVKMQETRLPRVDTLALIGNAEFYGPRLIQGRYLDSRDNLNAQKTALISESMAKRYWPDSSPLHQALELELDGEMQSLVIVGVVSDKMNGFAMFAEKHVHDEVYVSGLQFGHGAFGVYFKYLSQPERAEQDFYNAFFYLAADQDPPLIDSAQKLFEMTREVMVFVSWVTFSCGGFALFLALTGIYGITANSIAQRTHEIGLRRALGAKDSQIIAMFMRQGSQQLCLGLGAGMAAFAGFAYLFHGFVRGLLSLGVYAGLATGVSCVLALVVLLAIYRPMARAVEMEPANALRYE